MFPFIYNIIYTIVFLIYVPIFLGKSILKNKALFNLKERFGFIDIKKIKNYKTILIHTVSVGELLSVKHLIEKIKEDCPKLNIIITTITPAAYNLAKNQFNKFEVSYFPFDWSFTVKRFLSIVQPDLVILVESEFWLNFLYYCKKNEIPILLVNGRISEKAYKRYRFIKKWFSKKLNIIHEFYMQSQIDAQRLKEIGIEEKKIRVLGNLKFDIKPEEKSIATEILKTWLNNKPSILIGSSMKGEEELILNIYRELKKKFPLLKLIIAPRNPERFNEVSDLINTKGFSLCKRSEATIRDSDVFLLDTVGELAGLYKLATIVIIGGSLLPYGGHNLIEPAYFAKPIIIGNHMENFKEIAEQFIENKGCLKSNIENLASLLENLLKNEQLRNEIGENSYGTIQKNLGATDKILKVIMNIL